MNEVWFNVQLHTCVQNVFTTTWKESAENNFICLPSVSLYVFVVVVVVVVVFLLWLIIHHGLIYDCQPLLFLFGSDYKITVAHNQYLPRRNVVWCTEINNITYCGHFEIIESLVEYTRHTKGNESYCCICYCKYFSKQLDLLCNRQNNTTETWCLKLSNKTFRCSGQNE